VLIGGKYRSIGLKRMSIPHNLKRLFSSKRINAPDFGSFLFMFIPKAPERSYWEPELRFPKTRTEISVGYPTE
jgi:hypothetical protein